MINIFGVKYQKNQEPGLPDGGSFINASIDSEQNDKIAGFDQKVKTINNKTKLPMWLTIISHSLLFLSIVLIISILAALQDSSATFQSVYQKAPWMFIVLPIAFVIWAGIRFYKRRLTITVKNSEEVAKLQGEAETIIQQSKEQLGIPSDAFKVDTLQFFYEEKDGKVKHKALGGAQYFNVEMHLWKDNDQFHLADLARRFSFPLASISAIKKVSATISIDIWNKKESIQDKKYLPYKIRANSTGALFLRDYIVLTLKVNDQEYSIFFPSYELESLQSCLGILPKPEK